MGWISLITVIGMVFCQDDGQGPNYVYVEPIEDFYTGAPIAVEIIITDRSAIEEVRLYYRFSSTDEFTSKPMEISHQPVIYATEIPFEDVESGSLQYYFWAKDEHGNQSTWPEGGEDLPMVLPVFPALRKAEPKDKIKAKDEVVFDLGDRELESTLPYYIEMSLLSPMPEVSEDDGVSIIVISVYDPEESINPDEVKLIVDDKDITKLIYISPDMITYVPANPFFPGNHFIRFQSIDIAGENLIKDFAFRVIPSEILDEEQVITWREKINFKGDAGWNTDYDQSPTRPIDTHKINSKIKFQLGDYKFSISGIVNTHIVDSDARIAAKRRQPSNRLKLSMKSPHLDFNYGDYSPEFSEFTIKGTRVRGIYSKLKWGWWEAAAVSGEAKHWIDSEIAQIDYWNQDTPYNEGDKVFYENSTWIANFDQANYTPGDTSGVEVWTLVEGEEYDIIANDYCVEVDPSVYGMVHPDDPLANFDEFANTIYYWNGQSCEEVAVFSTISMATGQDDLGIYLFESLLGCLQTCTVGLNYEKGSPIRTIQAARTSIDLFRHLKLGFSAMRAWESPDPILTPYSILDDKYTYLGNFATGGDFSLHFFNDKTVLNGEAGLSIAVDKSTSDDYLLLKSVGKDPNEDILYSYVDWGYGTYCLNGECELITYDDTLFQEPDTILGLAYTDPETWEEIQSIQNQITDLEKFIGFRLNDDIGLDIASTGYGVSGFNVTDAEAMISGDGDPLELLKKNISYKLDFKTPIPLYITTLDLKAEYKRIAPNYFTMGNSSVQTDIEGLKSSARMRLWKNQIALSSGYDQSHDNIWENTKDATTTSKTTSGSIGLSLKSLPTVNYSLRLMERTGIHVQIQDSITASNLTTTHTVAPSYKFEFLKTGVSLNGNIMLMNYEDYLPIEEGSQSLNFLTSAYTSAMALSFEKPLSINIGGGISTNIPEDKTQSETVFTVISTKIGYKFWEKTLNVAVGINFVIGFKDMNGYWDTGEEFTIDYNGNEEFDEYTSEPWEDFGLDSLAALDNNDDGDFDDEGDIPPDEGENNGIWDSYENLLEDYNENGIWDEYGSDTFTDKIEIDNAKLTVKTGIQYKVSKDFTIGLNLDFVSSADNLDPSKNKSEMRGKLQIKYGF